MRKSRAIASDRSPSQVWLGGTERDGKPVHARDALCDLLGDAGFDLLHEEEMPLLIKEHDRKYQARPHTRTLDLAFSCGGVVSLRGVHLWASLHARLNSNVAVHPVALHGVAPPQ